MERKENALALLLLLLDPEITVCNGTPRHLLPWPANKRLKEVGLFNLASCEQGLEGFGLFLGTEVLSYSVEEMQVIFMEMRKALNNPEFHASYPL